MNGCSFFEFDIESFFFICCLNNAVVSFSPPPLPCKFIKGRGGGKEKLFATCLFLIRQMLLLPVYKKAGKPTWNWICMVWLFVPIQMLLSSSSVQSSSLLLSSSTKEKAESDATALFGFADMQLGIWRKNQRNSNLCRFSTSLDSSQCGGVQWWNWCNKLHDRTCLSLSLCLEGINSGGLHLKRIPIKSSTLNTGRKCLTRKSNHGKKTKEASEWNQLGTPFLGRGGGEKKSPPLSAKQPLSLYLLQAVPWANDTWGKSTFSNSDPKSTKPHIVL